MKFLPLIGRILFSLIFLISAPGHFSSESIGYAASQGVPAASVLVPFSGILELIGGLSVLLGYKTKWGAWILLVFLVPVTFMLHAFWNITDPMQYRIGMVMFLKNISMIGGAAMIAYFGAGAYSLDAKAGKATQSGQAAFS